MSDDSRRSRPVNLVSVGLIGCTVLYVGLLLFSPDWMLPGEPVWAIQAETLREIIDESINFFFVLPLLNRAGFSGMIAPNVHPLMQAFFNFAEAWIFMFLPLLLLDPRGGTLPRTLIWILAMFLTNVFLMPYMAARLFQPPAPSEGSKTPLLKSFGLVGLIVGTGAIAWPFWMQPESGTFAEQGVYFLSQVSTNRVTLAFCIDLILFYIFQVWLMGAIMPSKALRPLRFVPFWGLAIWLIF